MVNVCNNGDVTNVHIIYFRPIALGYKRFFEGAKVRFFDGLSKLIKLPSISIELVLIWGNVAALLLFNICNRLFVASSAIRPFLRQGYRRRLSTTIPVPLSNSTVLHHITVNLFVYYCSVFIWIQLNYNSPNNSF